MLAMILVATALSRISIVHTRPSNEGTISTLTSKKLYNSDDDMTHDMTEQLFGTGREIKKRDHFSKYDPPPKKQRSPDITDDIKKRPVIHSEDIDVVDRADHVTQYLTDLLINTDSEITSLQAIEEEEEVADRHEMREDTFFSFLTGLEKTLEVEGAWSRPVAEERGEEEPNVAMDEE